jgi:hypothetical protein
MMNNQGKTLADYLSDNAFANAACSTVEPSPPDAEGFKVFMERYKACIAVEKAAVKEFKD